eukprot:c17269_g1_i1 orf=741-1892(+)
MEKLFALLGTASVAVAVVIVLILCTLMICLRKHIFKGDRAKCKESRPSKLIGRAGTRVFTFQEMETYSEGFSNRVGEGTTNYVYKGILPDGTEVAIKRTKEAVAHSSDVEGSFYFQVELLSSVNHQHLVNLVGFCQEKKDQMLVFQYAPNGTLYESLHGAPEQPGGHFQVLCSSGLSSLIYLGDEHLSWNQRMRIAVGVASGLAYLHHSCDPPVIHGDFRSCHVFLTEDYAAKVGGLGKVPITGSSELALVRKTGASVDPETVHKGVYSRAGDVYSFGILLLELISGRLVFSEESGMLVEWAAQFMHNRDQMMNLVDPRLSIAVSTELYSVCDIAFLCIQREALSRPCMKEALEMLVQALGIGTETAAPAGSPVTLKELLGSG